MTHKNARGMFVDALYGELIPRAREAFDEHLKACSACTKEFRTMQSVALTMDTKERDELSDEDWKAFWNTLEAGIGAFKGPMDRSPSRMRSFVHRFGPVLRLAGAAAALLLIGIGIGRYVLSDDDSPSLHERRWVATPTEQAAIRNETLGYLERSKVLLLGIVNSDDIMPEPEQLKRQQEVSRMLVSESGVLRERLTRSGQKDLSELVNDLEVLLLQIANLEIENDFPGMEIIRGGVDRRGILLKINVEQMKAQRQRSLPASPGKESTSSRSMI